MEKVRRTRGESSASTESARRAVVARWGVGRGMWRVLGGVSWSRGRVEDRRRSILKEKGKEEEEEKEGGAYSLQGKSSGVDLFVILSRLWGKSVGAQLKKCC